MKSLRRAKSLRENCPRTYARSDTFHRHGIPGRRDAAVSWDAVFPPGPGRWQVAAIAFSRDGGVITVASLDSANNVAVIRRGDMTAGNGQPPTRLDGIRSIVLSPDGS